MQLTQEYFDKGLSNLIDKIDGLDSKMVTKDELKVQLGHQTLELKQYVQQSFETQQEYLDERFNELIIKYDVRERVEKLEKDVAQLMHNA